jgi:hypothetical protein
MRVTHVQHLQMLEGRASGELDGTGRWTFSHDGRASHVRYHWSVDVTKPWMRALAPLLRPVFAWNHGVVMKWGCEGLRNRLAR